MSEFDRIPNFSYKHYKPKTIEGIVVKKLPPVQSKVTQTVSNKTEKFERNVKKPPLNLPKATQIVSRVKNNVTTPSLKQSFSQPSYQDISRWIPKTQVSSHLVNLKQLSQSIVPYTCYYSDTGFDRLPKSGFKKAKALGLILLKQDVRSFITTLLKETGET